MAYMTSRALKGLKAYQYKPGGYTILDTIHNPFWNWLVERLPMWLAPNLITLTGLVGVFISYLLSAYYLPDFTGEAPRWLYLFNAAAVVIYINLDCIDGKQARRTGSSSPLGQLFDHGCDAVSLHLLLATTRCSLGLGCGWIGMGMEISIMVPWILAHWEEYHTGNMLYGNGYIGVLEGNYSLALIHLVSAVAGPGVWSLALPVALPGYLSAIKTVQDVVFVISAVSTCALAWGNVHRVLVFKSSELPEKERGHKQLGDGAAFQHLTYLFLMLLLGAVWLMDRTNKEPGQCRLVDGTFGAVYALIATQLIIAHMAKEPFMPFTWGMALLALGSFNSHMRLVEPVLAAAVLAAIAVVGYTHYVTSVVMQICEFLEIKCLTIKHRAT